MTRSSLLKPLAAVKSLSGLGSGSALAALTNPGASALPVRANSSQSIDEASRALSLVLGLARISTKTYSADLALLETFNGAGARVATDSKTCGRGKHIPDFQVPRSASFVAQYQHWLWGLLCPSHRRILPWAQLFVRTHKADPEIWRGLPSGRLSQT
ncbi:unnamed protein product [Clonostachys rosea]|uniref:Uncharacterized protein n=1 Tax=Bionectria ochroleuca TaxID=29856 RepID=A0ABY6UUF2_BIOOC|nr:unnamed protein product [Clonostachys rosea]